MENVVGIDLGTSNSVVAIVEDGVPTVIPNKGGYKTTPSMVAISESSKRLVGHIAKRQAVTNSVNTVYAAKRLIGRKWDSPAVRAVQQSCPYTITEGARGDVRIVLRDQVYSVPEISAFVLQELKMVAEQYLGGPVEKAVITVPAYFNDNQRQATKDAGRIAGLEVIRIINEPTAAALAYGFGKDLERKVAVYDLGGGTFDISLLRLRDGVFQVLATGGDSALGGDDFDRALAGKLLEQAGASEPTGTQLQEALRAARAAKEALSERESVEVELPRSGLGKTTITRDAFEAMIAPLVDRTIRASKRVLADAGVDKREIDGVVLVGGSTRVPLVREQVGKAFGREPLADIDPDKVVAYGAAIQADILSGSEREGVTLLDVVPLSLGLETMGGIVEKIIPRNATIPISARQVFTNYSEKQTAMSMHVVQGERELAKDCRSLARFELRGIPRLPPSMARVEVTFELDADALLTVTARELMTGVKQSIEVKPTYGLSAEEVDNLVMDSLDHAREDFEARNLAEARVELGRVALAVRTALAEVGEVEGLLGADERGAIEQALEQADAQMAAAEHADPVNGAREQLEKVSEGFARRRMERALRAGMTGKSLDEIEAALAEEEQLAARRGAHSAEIVEP